MRINRTYNAISGTIFGIIQRLISILFPFVIRTIFIKTLGAEYLGLNSLFTSILQVLNLAELGVASAFVFSMYKPIADSDETKICALMNLYKKYYRIIGLIVLVLGLALIPFLRHLISGEIPADINLYAIYLMNLVATVLSYWLFAYRNSLFQAHQRTDIISIITSIMSIIMYSAQIVFLIVFENYYVYLAIQIGYQIGLNIITAIASKKMYPGYNAIGNVSVEEKNEISGKIKDLFTAKIGGVINNSADSIVISSFLGLTLLAVYNNYYYIISALMAFFSIFFSACSAGIGNSLIVKNKKDNVDLFYRINFIVFFALNFCCASLIAIYPPFMNLWVGEEFTLEFVMEVLFATYLFAEEAPRTMLIFKDAGGIWKEDKFRPLVGAVVNLVSNIILVQFIGLYGIIISTVGSLLLINIPWLIYNINKHLINIGSKKFILKFSLYTVVIALISTLNYFVCSYIAFENLYITIFLRLAVCIVLPNVLFSLTFCWTDEFKYLVSLIRTIYMKVINKIKSFLKLKNHSGGVYDKKFDQYSFKGTKCSSYEGYEAVITRYYHTIEKGLSYINYRAGFGKNNIDLLISSMKNYISDGFPQDSDFYRTGLSILHQYYEKNKEYGQDDIEFISNIKKLPGEPNELGGLYYFDKPETMHLTFNHIMKDRHSIREFDGTPVDVEILKRATELAQYTPSACNRQGWKTRIIADKEVVLRVLANQNGNKGFTDQIDKLLLVTSDLRYFNSDREKYQPFIDGGMYAENVINSLFYYGIASIPLSASLTDEQENNVRYILKLHDAEVLILFIGVGNYKEHNQTAKSDRKEVDVEVI